MPDKAVFVVDDDTAVRQGLRFMLSTAGYFVQAFSSAASFLKDYDPRRGGCLLLDVRMPQMTGLVGEGEHFPAFRARSGSGGSAAGRQRRSRPHMHRPFW